MNDSTPKTTPSERVSKRGSKNNRKKLKNPALSPEDPRAGRVTLTTPLRDLQTLDLVVSHLKSAGAVRVNRSTVLRALARYARNQMKPQLSQATIAAQKRFFAELKNLHHTIDGESYR
jgi:hypothetical protein